MAHGSGPWWLLHELLEGVVEMVQAIFGVCIVARDARALADWYKLHLGLDSHYSEELDAYCHEFLFVDPQQPEQKLRFCWAVREATGQEVPSAAMLCYRVRDLDEAVDQLRVGGILIDESGKRELGRYVRLRDPEGNAVELLEEHHAVPRHNVVLL